MYSIQWIHTYKLMSKNVATFVHKVGLIWLKSAFLLHLFRTQMYFLALNCYHWDKRDNRIMCPGGSPNIKGVEVPVRNFHDKPKKITAKFSSTTFRPLKDTKI